MSSIILRNRMVYAGLIAMTIAAGLASRRFAVSLPVVLRKNTGDILWATMVFFVAGWILPRWSALRTAAIAAVFCLCIEVAKLYSAPWLEAVRHTIPGRLVFGYVFSWSNLVCYAIGIGLGVVVELPLVPAIAARLFALGSTSSSSAIPD